MPVPWRSIEGLGLFAPTCRAHDWIGLSISAVQPDLSVADSTSGRSRLVFLYMFGLSADWSSLEIDQ